MEQTACRGMPHNLDTDTIGKLAVLRRRIRLPPICQWSDDACAAGTFASSVHDMPEGAELTTGMSGPQFPCHAQNSAGDMLADHGSVSQSRSANSAVAAVDRLGYPNSTQGGYMRAKFGVLAASTTAVSYAMHRHKESDCVAAGPVIMLRNGGRLQRRPPT
jgi:hypothetical protein